MKQAELDAAVESVRNSFRTIMAEKGYAQYINQIESQVNYVDVVQFALQAAEDVRLGRKVAENEDAFKSGSDNVSLG